MSEENQAPIEKTEIKVADFFNELSQKVSAYNAKLMMDSVVLGVGIVEDREEYLDTEQVKAVCLELIKKGGPAFQVGKHMYTRLQ